MRNIIVGSLSLVFFGSCYAQDSIPGSGFAAIPGQKGGQDVFGAYDVVEGWPQNTSTLPGQG